MSSIPPRMYYVYLLTYPDGTPFYVGKGTESRIAAHAREARKGCSCRKCGIIQGIWRIGTDFGKIIVIETSDESEAFASERALIALYGRHTLTNKTNGGEGASGYRHTPEAIAKIRAASMGRQTRLGHHRSAADNRRVSEKLKGRVITPEARTKIGDALRGMVHKPEHGERVRLRQLGRKLSGETREKMRAAQTVRWAKRKQSKE